MAEQLVAAEFKSVTFLRVANGWAVYQWPSLYDANMDRMQAPLGVARTSDELAAILMEWAKSQEQANG